MTEFDTINKAQHYNSHPSGVECIDVARHLTGAWFNAFKYVFRAEHKNGRQDLEKALYYINDAHEHYTPMRYTTVWPLTVYADLEKIIMAETGERRAFFIAIKVNSPHGAREAMQRILAE